MSSKVPTVRQTNWISVVPHLIIMGVIILFWYQISPENAFLYGAMTYLLISFSLRKLIPKDHRKGIKKVNSENFQEGIRDFENSYDFFQRNGWIDKYRFITLLSSSKMCYREMALANIAFCHGQIGNGEKSKMYYERTLKEFPENGLAKSALKMIKSIEKKGSTSNGL